MSGETLKAILLFPFRHIRVILLTLLVALLIFALRFPSGDLADWISVKVAEASGNQLFVEFESMNFVFFPGPGLRLSEPSIQKAGMAPVRMNALKLNLRVLNVLRLAPGAKVSAEGLWGSELNLDWRSRERTPEGGHGHRLDADLRDLDLSQLAQALDLPVQIRGNTNLRAEALIEPEFTEQPQMDLELTSPRLELMPSRIFIPNFGPMDLPQLNWSQVSLGTRLENGELHIDDLRLGSRQDPVSARLRGRAALRVVKQPNGNLVPQTGRYDFRVELVVRQDAPQLVQLALVMLDSFKTQSPEGEVYLFRATGERFGPAPQLSPLTRFEQ